jgi:uncharacterized protein YbjQ (UPF0145 family)
VAAFTSGLSIADFAMTRLAGVEPVRQVMGSSVHQVGWQSFPARSGYGSGESIELGRLTGAWNSARRAALDRLEDEARQAGCHVVVDVTFEDRRHDFVAGAIEVVVNGTAVRRTDGTAGERPVLTDLSMADYLLLRQGGYEPVGVVASTSVQYVVAGWSTRQATTRWQRFQPNQELVDYTQGIYDAREWALFRATRQAEEAGAAGMVGMRIDHDVATREYKRNDVEHKDLIVTFHVLGTAIAPAGEHRPLEPRTIVRQGAA